MRSVRSVTPVSRSQHLVPGTEVGDKNVLGVLRRDKPPSMSILPVAVALLIGMPALAGAAPTVVILRDGVEPAAKAASVSVTPTHRYTAALHGFSGDVSSATRARLRADPDVLDVAPDTTRRYTAARSVEGAIRAFATAVEATPQTVSPGLRRVGADRSPTAKIDGVDERVDVDVAILDTGIQANHPDLNVVGGVDCVSGLTSNDLVGHGTMVAGVVGALDNGFGTVGVAPGARLWSVRVLSSRGTGSTSSILCGIDWVTRNAATIEVANMSLGQEGESDDACGTVNGELMHAAICESTAAGVTYAAAAGNQAGDSSAIVPAAYPEVVAVAAIADTDGAPGGLGPPDDCFDYADDSLAAFSNFGPRVSIAAPGVCIESTAIRSRLAVNSGTSFAAPFVAGAAALYAASVAGRAALPLIPLAGRPAAIRAALIGAATRSSVGGAANAGQIVLDVSDL
jgi:subtilisin